MVYGCKVFSVKDNYEQKTTEMEYRSSLLKSGMFKEGTTSPNIVRDPESTSLFYT